MEIRKILAANVRRYRREKCLSQEALAFTCNIHRTYISGVERGIRNPTVAVVAKNAAALDVGPERLLAAPTREPET